MNPVEPAIVEEGSQLLTFAKNQPPYLPLPAVVDITGKVVTEWEPTAEELHTLFEGGHIRLTLLYAVGMRTCGQCGHQVPQPLSPIKLEVVAPECGFGEAK